MPSRMTSGEKHVSQSVLEPSIQYSRTSSRLSWTVTSGSNVPLQVWMLYRCVAVTCRSVVTTIS